MIVILLVEVPSGDYIGVMFPGENSAREWENSHDTTVRGVVPVVNRQAALKLSKDDDHA